MWPVIGALIPIIKDLIGLVPNAEQKAELLKTVQQAELELAKGQLEVNAEEAKSDSFFVAGWRPATGWMCNIGLAWYIIAPSLGFPVGGVETLVGILMGMLGLGGLRSYDKKQEIKAKR